MSPNLPSLPTLPEVTASTSQNVATSSQRQDFFSAIEKEHPTTFNPQISKTGYVQRGSNPFAQLANGQPQIALQPTGFTEPQQTAIPHQPNAFGNFQSQSQPTGFQQMQQQQSSWFLQSSQQQTFLQPQPTGRNNPFRQSMLVPQSTGMVSFGVTQGQSTHNGQPSHGAPSSLPGGLALSSPFSTIPTLLEPTLGLAGNGNASQSRQSSEQPLPQQQTGAADISNATSSFTFNPNATVGSTISDKSSSNISGFIESQQTGTTATGLAFSDPRSLQSNTSPAMPGLPSVSSHATQLFGGLKSFIPSSSFGTSLMESLLFPGSSPSTVGSPISGKLSSNSNGTTATGSAFPNSCLPQSNTFFGASLLESLLLPGSSPNAVTSTISDKSSSNNLGFMGSQQTGTTATGLAQSNKSPTMPGPPSAVTSHSKGFFGGPNPFIPSPSFGASLMDSLLFLGSSPTDPTTNTNTINRLATSPGADNQISSPSSNDTVNFSFLNNQPTGATGGFGGTSSTYESSSGVVGLRPQMTAGRGAADPLQASSPLSHSRNHRPEFGWQLALQQTSMTDRRDPEVLASTEVSQADIQTQHRVAPGKGKEKVPDEFFETQTLGGPVFDWEDILRTQLQEGELLALSDGHLSQEGAWFLSLRRQLAAEDNAVASSTSTSYIQNSNRGFTTLEPLPMNEFPEETHECGVCNDLFCVALSVQLPTCKHSFCRECLRTFTKVKIDEGRYPILCPVCAVGRSGVGNSHITQEIINELELSCRDLKKLYALQLIEQSVVWDCPRCKQTMNIDREEYASQRIIICPLPACGHAWCKERLKSLARGDTEHNCKQRELTFLCRRKDGSIALSASYRFGK